MGLLSIQNIGKIFTRDAGAAGVQRIDLEVEQGELISLLGPSGCGKTTTLRCIAGLEKPDHGRIELNGTVLFADRTTASRDIDLPPERRGVGMVFQDYALWPHMDVFDNVAFGLRSTRHSRGEISDEVESSLRSVRLWDHRDKRISQLSGGQQQRVALARALAARPKVVLFDEPLSNLDAQLRDDLRGEVLDLHTRLGLTSIWVTHDQEEALGMSSRVVLMNEGHVEQIARPADLWNTPLTPFAAAFMGVTSSVSGDVVASDQAIALEFDRGLHLILPPDCGLRIGERATAYVRAGAVGLAHAPPVDAVNALPVDIVREAFHGDYTMLTLRAGNTMLTARVDGLREGSPPRFAVVPPSQLHVFRNLDH